MNESKIKNFKIVSDTKKIKDDLLDLANKSNDEIKKNESLKYLLTLIKNQINENKQYLSLLSSLGNKSNNVYKKNIENELINHNKKAFESNESIKKELTALKEKYSASLTLLNKNLEQQKNVLESIKETNFLLDNKIKEKDAIINRMRELKMDLEFNIVNFEVNKNICRDSYGEIEEFERTIDFNLMFNREYYHEYLLYKASKFNKAKNKVIKLITKKDELKNMINKNSYKKSKIVDINYDKKQIEDEKINNKCDNNDEMIIPTNIATDGSLSNLNDSLFFDTDEQINIELPENDFSSYYLSQKSLGFNIVKKKLFVPKLDLKQIKYNLINNNSSSKEISLSRLLENGVSYEIKKIKKQIKSYKRQKENLEKKIEKYEKKIMEIALFLYSNQ